MLQAAAAPAVERRLCLDGVSIKPAAESRGLTGLRGLGALLVTLHHFALNPALQWPVPSLNGLLLKGYLGVDLFFVLSGFVMAMVYGSWFPGPAPGRRRRTALFLVRRAARLWPLHLVVLGAIVAWRLSAGDAISVNTVLLNAALLQAWGVSAGINVPAWSVSTELVAYLLLPVLAGPLLRSRLGVPVGLAAVAGLLAVAGTLAPPVGDMRRGELDIYYNYSLLPVLRCLAGFTVGLLAWRWGRSAPVRRLASTTFAGPLALALMLALMLAKANDVLIYPLLPAIVLGFHAGHGPAWRAVAQGPLYRLGILSYALYLVHYSLLRAFPLGWAPAPAEMLAFVAAAAAVAAVAHVAVELPARRIIRSAGTAIIPRFGPRVRRPPPLQPGSG